MMSPKGIGGVDVPPVRRPQRSHSEAEDTPTDESVRRLVREEQDERIRQRGLVEQAGIDAKEARRAAESAERKAQAAQDTTSNFSWKLNLILTGVAATLATVVGIGAWTLTQVQTVKRESVIEARDAGGDAARDAFAEERKSLHEELKSDRAETIREFRRQEKAEVDTLVARAPR